MNLPNLSAPVIRSGNTSFNAQGIDPSCSAACQACKVACKLLPWPASTVCEAACGIL